MKKIIVLFISLAIVAGLFVFFLLKEPKDLWPDGLPGAKEETLENQALKTNQSGQERANDNLKEPKEGWDLDALAKAISDTVLITEDDGLRFFYSQPEIPKEYHLCVKFQIFDENGKTIDRYVSDAGWRTEESNYDPSKKDVELLMNEPSLKGKLGIVSVKISDEAKKESATYQLTINYDGSRNLEHARRDGNYYED